MVQNSSSLSSEKVVAFTHVTTTPAAIQCAFPTWPIRMLLQTVSSAKLLPRVRQTMGWDRSSANAWEFPWERVVNTWIGHKASSQTKRICEMASSRSRRPSPASLPPVASRATGEAQKQHPSLQRSTTPCDCRATIVLPIRKSVGSHGWNTVDRSTTVRLQVCTPRRNPSDYGRPGCARRARWPAAATLRTHAQAQAQA